MMTNQASLKIVLAETVQDVITMLPFLLRPAT